MMNWKVKSSTYLSRRPWFTVRRECVELPNGRQIPEYYVFEYPEWVNTIAITKDNQFVMIRQYRHALARTSYELCAGVCDQTDSSHLESAKRELLEETGYAGGTWREHMVICANPATQNNLTHCFVATGVEKVAEQSLDLTEDITVHLLSLDEVKELLSTNQIAQALNAAPLWKYIAENKLY